MNDDVIALAAYAFGGALGGAVVYVVGRAWWTSWRKGRRLADVYERLAQEPPSVEPSPVLAPPMRLRAVEPVAAPKREALRLAVEHSVIDRIAARTKPPTSRAAPAQRRVPIPARWQSSARRPSEDEDDDLWLRRSLDVQVAHSHAPNPVGFDANLTLPSTPEPPFAGGGGKFGGAGASGGWGAPAAAEPASPEPSFDASSSPDTGSFGGEP